MQRPGDTLSDTITVIDNQQNGIEGLTFDKGNHYYGWMPDGSPMDLSRVSWEELGEGVYKFSVVTYFPGDTAGLYILHVDSPDAFSQSFTMNWTLQSRFIYPVTGGTSRMTLRRLILAKFGDLLVLKATRNAPTDDSLIDEINLYLEPGSYRGREVIFTGGQTELRGVIRNVSASSRATNAIKFGSPLPVPTRIGDEVEMVNSHGMGVTIQAVHLAIDYAISMAQDYALIPVAYPVPIAFEGSAYAITVPDEIVGIESVMWMDSESQLNPLDRATGQGEAGWAMQHGSHTIMVNGYVGRSVKGLMLTINGYVLPEVPENDTDEVHIDREWLVNTALAHLCHDIVMSRQSSADWGQRGDRYQSRADVLLGRLTPNLGPSFVRF